MHQDFAEDDSVRFDDKIFIRFKSEKNQQDQPNIQRKISDPIYKFINFNDCVWNVIDTPIYQRLRNIRQLGATYLVFQGANHTRFEHCLGVGYQAKKFVKTIQKNQPTLFEESSSEHKERIQDLVAIAGVIHDLGHGPFSHMFDNLLIPKLTGNNDWNHEQGSEDLFRYLCEVYSDKIDLQEHEINYIIDLVHGDRSNQEDTKNNWIFDIVSNQRNSIDVDKIDYLARDSYNLGLNDTLSDFSILMKESRVIDNEICYPAKYCMNIYDIFQTRYKLYKTVYLNRVSQAIEQMLCDVFLETNHHFKFDQIIHKPGEYYKLNDTIIEQIDNSDKVTFKKAQQIIKRIKGRDLYKYVAEVFLSTDFRLDDNAKMRRDIFCYTKKNSTNDVSEDQMQFECENNSGQVGFGLKDDNPVSKIGFFRKSDYKTKIQMDRKDVSLCIPTTFNERFVRVFVSDGNQLENVKEAFEKYCRNNLQTSPGVVDGSQGGQSPYRRSNTMPIDNCYYTPTKQIKKND